MSESDEALVQRSRQGDRAAFEELLVRTGRLVFARIYLDTGDRDKAEDLAQETFLLAWRYIADLDHPAGFRGWLLSIAQSVVIDAGRRESRKKRSGPRAEPQALQWLVDRAPRPPEAAEQAESRRLVMEALRSLPEDYRLPLMLRYIAGADHQTIGRQLGLSNGSLRGFLSRGMALLRQRMQNLARGA